MEKKVFSVILRFGDELKFANIRYDHNDGNIEYFYLQFIGEDEWNSFTTSDGETYDIHFLFEIGWQVSIYRVVIRKEPDKETGIILDFLDTDTSEDGQQAVNLTVEGDDFGNK